MKRKSITCIILVAIIMTIVFVQGSMVEAKTYKSIPDGGYIIKYKKAKIKGGKLGLKGTVRNWERASSTPEFKKKGKFKLAVSKNCEILDGYKPSYTISKKKFNKLCKDKDDAHKTVAFVVSDGKVESIRFW